MKDELVDALDGHMRKTGEVLMKSLVHDRELWHASVHVWVYNSQGEVLLQFRSAAKQLHPSKWDVSVGGHIDAGAEPAETAIRESHEELGIDIQESDLEFVGVSRSQEFNPNNNRYHRDFHWTYIYKCDADAADFTLEKGEVDKVRWVAIDELDKELADPATKQKLHLPRPKYTYDMALVEIQKRLAAA